MPQPWNLEPAVWVALIGLVGVLSGVVGNRMSQAETQRLAELDALVKGLSSRVSALEQALATAETSRDQAMARAYEAETSKWHAVSYARALLAWARSLLELVPEDVAAPTEPMPPPELDAHV